MRGLIARLISGRRSAPVQDPESLMQRCRELTLGGDAHQALVLLDEQLRSRASSAELHQLRGTILQREGDPAAAEAFRAACAIDPQQPLWVKYAAGMPAYSAIVLQQPPLIYFAMPKCGSSSIKSLMRKVESGENHVYAHDFYEQPNVRTQTFTPLRKPANSFCFAIAREPVERFLSYYQKNVIEESALTTAAEQDTGLNTTPELNEFISHLEHYVFAFHDCRAHLLPQSAYLRDVLADIDQIYTLDQIPDLHRKICALAGADYDLSHMLKSAAPANRMRAGIEPDNLRKLQAYYREDLALWDSIDT